MLTIDLKKTAVVAFSLSCILCAFGQLKMINEQLYLSRVKLVDEFFDRFNCKEFTPGINPNEENAKMLNLCSLFDFSKIKSSKDSAYQRTIEFVDTIISHNVVLNYSDSSWCAVVKCKAIYKAKPTHLTLMLRVENRMDDMYKWTICSAKGECLALSPSKRPAKAMLYPDDHETSFMSLSRITTENNDLISLYTNKEYKTDQLAVFLALVYNNLLTIEYVEDIEFVFYQVPNHVFRVKFFERDSSNSGWLISSFSKLTIND